MKKIIQTLVAPNGDVHLDFSGFVGHDCQTEEARLRRELAALGLAAQGRVSRKSSDERAGIHQSHHRGRSIEPVPKPGSKASLMT